MASNKRRIYWRKNVNFKAISLKLQGPEVPQLRNKLRKSIFLVEKNSKKYINSYLRNILHFFRIKILGCCLHNYSRPESAGVTKRSRRTFLILKFRKIRILSFKTSRDCERNFKWQFIQRSLNAWFTVPGPLNLGIFYFQIGFQIFYFFFKQHFATSRK